MIFLDPYHPKIIRAREQHLEKLLPEVLNNINECPICHEKLRVLDYVGIDRPPIMNEPYYDKSDKWKYLAKREPVRNSNRWIEHLSKNYDTPRIARKRKRL